MLIPSTKGSINAFVSGESDFDHYEIRRAADSTLLSDHANSISILNDINLTTMNSVPLVGINYYQIFVVDRHEVETGSDIVSVTK